MKDFFEDAPKLNAGRVRSMDMITAAMFELLEQMPFAQISITELCARAGVTRKTFYSNFTDKKAVVERLVDRVFFESTQKMNLATVGAKKVYLYWYEYILCTREFSLIFFDDDLFPFITGKIREFVETELAQTLHNAASFDPLLSEYYLGFTAAGIASVMREWMKNGCVTPAKTMASLTAKLLSGIVI